MQLLKLSWITFVISFVLLIALYYSYDVYENSFDNIGEDFKIRGKVIKVTHTENAVFLKMEQMQEIDAMFFPEKENYSYLEGRVIQAKGHIYDNVPILDEVFIN